MATFAEVFAHTAVWQATTDVALIRSPFPLQVRYDDLERRLAQPCVRRILAAMATESPYALLAEMAMNDAQVRACAKGRRDQYRRQAET